MKHISRLGNGAIALTIIIAILGVIEIFNLKALFFGVVIFFFICVIAYLLGLLIDQFSPEKEKQDL